VATLVGYRKLGFLINALEWFVLNSSSAECVPFVSSCGHCSELWLSEQATAIFSRGTLLRGVDWLLLHQELLEDLQPFHGKGPHPLFWAGSRAEGGKL